MHVTADVEGWLKVDAAHCRVFDGEVDDSSDLMFVDSALYRGNQRHVQADGGETVEGKKRSMLYTFAAKCLTRFTHLSSQGGLLQSRTRSSQGRHAR